MYVHEKPAMKKKSHSGCRLTCRLSGGSGLLLFRIVQIAENRTDLLVRPMGWRLLRRRHLLNLLQGAFVLAQLHHFQEIGCIQQARLVLQALPAPLSIAQLILQLLFVLLQFLLSFQQTIDVTVDLGSLLWRRLGARSCG